jgi:hypothetical protein
LVPPFNTGRFPAKQAQMDKFFWKYFFVVIFLKCTAKQCTDEQDCFLKWTQTTHSIEKAPKTFALQGLEPTICGSGGCCDDHSLYHAARGQM